MQVVTWNVFFPRGSVVKGTAVEETNPTVCPRQKLIFRSSREKKRTLNGAKILDCLGALFVPFSTRPLTASFWRLTTWPWWV